MYAARRSHSHTRAWRAELACSATTDGGTAAAVVEPQATRQPDGSGTHVGRQYQIPTRTVKFMPAPASGRNSTENGGKPQSRTVSEELPPHTRATPDPQMESVPRGSAVRRRLTSLAVDVTPLRESREFRLLFIGQGVSFAGSMITYVAIPFQTYELTRSSLVVGLVSLAELVPILVMSFIGGALADAVDRRRMVRITQISACAVVGVLVVNATLPHPQLWVLFFAVVAAAGVDALERPSLDALVPRIVRHDKLSAAAALESLRGNLGQVLGPPLAGILIATVGLPATYGVDVGTFLVATVALTLMRAGAAGAGCRGSEPSSGAGGSALRGKPPGPPRLVSRRHQRDVLRHADGTIPADRVGTRRPRSARADVHGSVGGLAARDAHERLDPNGPSPRTRDRIRRRELGGRDHRLRVRAVALAGAARVSRPPERPT